MTITAPTFSLAGVATRWDGPRIAAADIVDWLVAEGFIVAVGTDTFVVTPRGIGVSALLSDSAATWLELEVTRATAEGII